MQHTLNKNSGLSTEFAILETLIKEQNRFNDPHTIPVNVIGDVRAYVQASEAILILFDAENHGWAKRKLLGAEPRWKSESAFLVRDSILCSSLPETITQIDYDSELDTEPDRVVYGEVTALVRKVILAPLDINGTELGSIIFINPAIDLNNEERYKFFQLIIKGLANAISLAEHNQQLTINNADLEATHWQILNSRNTLRTFFDNIPSSVYIIDRSYNIVAVNTRRSERVGKNPQELVGGKCYEKFWGNSLPCAACLVMNTFSGVPSVRNSKELGANETIVHWEITNVPIRESDNTINQVIVFEEDVTEKWNLEANLIQSEKMASIGQLAANVAHEINNPLAAIIANAQLLLRDLSDADEDIIDLLRLIEMAGDRAAKIVSNLLESARREKHHEFDEISLNETILDAISLLRYEINKSSVTVDLDLAEDIPDIFANKNQLKGVWINLVNNALGAIDVKRGKISISTRYENREFHVVFSDNGKGILPEHQEHIFEPFFTTKEAGKGTGLGLSVSFQAIQEHHGSIEFESAPDKGTKFIIILPDIEDRDAY